MLEKKVTPPILHIVDNEGCKIFLRYKGFNTENIIWIKYSLRGSGLKHQGKIRMFYKNTSKWIGPVSIYVFLKTLNIL